MGWAWGRERERESLTYQIYTSSYSAIQYLRDTVCTKEREREREWEMNHTISKSGMLGMGRDKQADICCSLIHNNLPMIRYKSPTKRKLPQITLKGQRDRERGVECRLLSEREQGETAAGHIPSSN